MKYQNIVEGVFIDRPNRFIANVKIAGEIHKVHVKNTGRCKELLLPEARVFLEKSNNPNRKTQFSLIGVYKGNMLINMDSQAPNHVVEEALREGRIKEIGTIDMLKRESKFGDSRFDFYYEKDGQAGYIEVKGVTLEVDGIAMFPDAPTQRGAKHVRELIKAKEMGLNAAIIFVVQLSPVKWFAPNWRQDMTFCEELKGAEAAGVTVLAYDCFVSSDELRLQAPVPIQIEP